MIQPAGPGGRSRRRALSSAPAVTRRSKGPPALTTPLRAGSPVPRSTGEDSPVRADSSGTAAPITVPSVGTTSPAPTSTTSTGFRSATGTAWSVSPS